MHAKGEIQKRPAVVNSTKPLPGPASAANPISRTSSTTRAHLTNVTFASLSISPLTKRAVAEILCYETLTAVQAETLPLALQGIDLIAKARTGTGKTVAFLLPTIERLLAAGRGDGGVRAVAISPTRELASQIHAEAEQLISFHPQLSSRAVVGGTKVQQDVYALAHRPPSILVATPGRLNDLLHEQGMLHAFSSLQVLIFDEADQLLDMGFRPAIERILSALRSTAATRQTLLFSATMPQDVAQVAKIATRPGAKMVDTVGEESNTNAQVAQSATVCAAAAQPAELFTLLQQLMVGEYKVVAILPKAYSEACSEACS